MLNELLQTKFYIPSLRSQFVSRSRLIERLNEGRRGKLALISAPAGFGKTVIVSDWLRQVDRPVAWLSCDEGDNDLTRFLTYFIGAIQTIEPDIGHTILSMLTAPQPPALESLIIGLINDITLKANPFLMVLDDYHVVETKPIHNALTFLIDHLPTQLYLIIISRADPPLPLARLRGRGELTELRASDLRFTVDETTTLLNESMTLNLSMEQIRALASRTEGWITGLHLLTLSIQGRQDQDDIDSFVNSFTGSHRYILDYLTDEVLSRQSAETQRFLLQTSILKRLSGSLCDAVCFTEVVSQAQGNAVIEQRNPGQTILESLDAANLFIIPLDDERGWYRYHYLFADLLRHRLHQTFPNQCPELHHRAAIWYEQQGLIHEAIDHASQAEAYHEVARLVEANAFSVLKRGELMTVLGWIQQIPAGIIHTRPWLSIWHAWALLLTGQVPQIEQVLAPLSSSTTELAVPTMIQSIESPDLQGHLCAIRAYMAALSHEPVKAMALAQQSLALLPVESRDVRSIVTFVLGGLSVMSGDVVGAAAAFTEAGETARSAGNINLAAPAIRALGDMQVVQGRLHQAAVTYQEALQLATGPGGQLLPVAAGAVRGLGELMYEWNDLTAAESYLEQALKLAEQWGQFDTVVSSYVALARLRQTQGQAGQARKLLQKIQQMISRHTLTPTVESALAGQQICLEVAAGNLSVAERYVRERGLQASDALSYAREVEYIALARFLLAQGKVDRVQDILDRLYQAAETGKRQQQIIKILILQMLVLQAKNDISPAMSVLEDALSLAEPEGYIRTIVDEGQSMAELLAKKKDDRGSRQEYVFKLLAAFEEMRDDRPASISPQPLVEPLSERELELLQLIAEGLSNQEIAQKLIIAVGTVKAHAASIYGKLGVHSRTQAVARARQLKLL